MKTRVKRIVRCGSWDNVPIARIRVPNDKGMQLYLSLVECTRILDERTGCLELRFLEQWKGSLTQTYHNAIGEGPDPISEAFRTIAEDLKLHRYARNGGLDFNFDLTRKQFTAQALELMFALNQMLGITETAWMKHLQIHDVTEVYYKPFGWQTYAGHMLEKYGIIEPSESLHPICLKARND